MKEHEENKVMLDEWQPEHRTLLASCINRFGTGDHPAADSEQSLIYFRRPYMIECLGKAVNSGKLSEKGLELVRSLIDKLKNFTVTEKDNQNKKL